MAMAMHDLGRGVWHDLDGTGYILLDLDIVPEQKTLIIEGTELSPKDEYHCSLVDVRGYIGKKQKTTKEVFIGSAVKEYLRQNDLRFAGLGDERYLCRKKDRATLVAPVRIDGFEDFARFIEGLIPGYRRPFLHVTLLMSTATPRGISINSEDDLLKYCERLTL